MTPQRADAEHARTDGDNGQTVRRRGLIAGAAALVATMIAKQATQPVVALDPNDLALGIFNNETSPTPLSYTGGALSSPSAALSVFDGFGTGAYTAMVAGIATGGKANTGVYGEGGGSNTGVYGLADRGTGVSGASNSVGVSGISPTFIGVSGQSYSGTGVSGQSNSGMAVQGQIPLFIGGVTNTAANTIAVMGSNQSIGAGGIGVQGQSDLATGTGVKGVSASGFPIIGTITGTGSATNVNAGVLGTGTKGPGVQGQSTGGHGLVGTTFATDGIHAALIGSVQPGGNAIGLRGSVPSGATGFAGVFDGDVTISGALRVFGSPKNAAVKHPGDGTYRLLYCMESPESWFEDFGKGTLAGGKAEITLDPDFAVLVHTDTYHVFLTAHGPQQLYVPQQSPAGFTVMAIEATPAGGPKAAEGGGTFSWRVVAKRKDIVGERLATVEPPPKPAVPTVFTVPESPVVTPPAKKP